MKYLLIILCFIMTLSSCHRDMNDVVNLKIKVLEISFQEDMYDTDQIFAHEEIFCEILNNDQYKNINIINYDAQKLKTFKKNQILKIGVRESDLNLKEVNINDVIWR